MNINEVYKLALDILSESLRYKTILGEDYEEIIDYYSSILSNHGIHVTVHRVPDSYVKRHLHSKYNPDKPRYILLARIGHGHRVLQFNGHYDIVPPGDNWNTPPFEPRLVNGKLYGRGSSDMKSGIAAFMATMIYYAQSREPGIVVEGVVVPDEEIGGITGTGYLVRELGSRPDWVVISEPSNIDNVYIGHRGNVWLMINVYGKQAHGSTPWLGDNAFEKMIVFARYFLDEYKKLLERKQSRFIYEDPRASKPTINPGGVLSSTGAFNIVPGVCGFSIDRRLIVEERVEGVLEEVEKLIREICEKTGVRVDVELIESSNPAYTPEDSEIVTTLRESIRKTTGLEPRLTICTGGLDLKYYSEKGIQAVSYGPGSPSNAHMVNEYVEVSDLYRVIDVYVNLVEELERLS